MTTGPAPAGPDGQELRAARIFLRPIANPFALGFTGLAGASLTMAGRELGWIAPADSVHVALILLIFAPLLQVISCVFGFLGRDPVAASGMGLLAGTWAVIGITELTSAPGSVSRALGTLLFLSGAAALIAAGTAAAGKLVPAMVVGVTGLRFIVTGVYQFVPSAGWKTAAGVVGVLVTFLAVYAVASLEIEGLRHAPLLPTLRLGRGRRALQPDLAAQVQEVAAEPGVRSQL